MFTIHKLLVTLLIKGSYFPNSDVYARQNTTKMQQVQAHSADKQYNLPCSDWVGSSAASWLMTGVYRGSEQSIEQRFLMILALGLVSRDTQHCTNSDRLHAALSCQQKTSTNNRHELTETFHMTHYVTGSMLLYGISINLLVAQ